MELKEKVIYCLESQPETRNDDALLTFWVIRIFLPDEMLVQENKWYISTNALRMIREDHVKRIRAKLQNEENRYLPTNPEVRKKRGVSEVHWRQYLGY